MIWFFVAFEVLQGCVHSIYFFSEIWWYWSTVVGYFYHIFWVIFYSIEICFITGTICAWACSLRRTTKLLFQEPSWSEWHIFSVFLFVYLLFLKNVFRLKIKVHNIQSWMSKWIFKAVKSCSRKMVNGTHLLNSKMVKSFLGRSNSNFGLNHLTSVVDMPCRIIIGKFQLLKQGFGFIVHTRIFKVVTF